MKITRRTICLWLAALLFALPCAAAEETALYADGTYEFRYPASWTCETSPDGTTILQGGDRTSAVLTFAIRTDMISFTGDTQQDAEYIAKVLRQYDGSGEGSLVLEDACEPASAGEFRGFRAFGSWGPSRRVEMVFMTGKGCMFLFIFAGEEAIAQEQAILASVDAPEPGA